MQTILGKKLDQTQKYLENGKRVAVTRISTKGNYVTRKTDKTYQIGFGEKKKVSQSVAGILKKAGVSASGLRTFKEAPLPDGEVTVGATIVVSEILQPGDIVAVSGTSKGKGFQGGVKRWGFKGGPRTHGQSDRERAPGSIGQTTTPGRVYKGKRMAGNMGNETVTVSNLTVLSVEEDALWLAGLVPGGRNSILTIRKTGEKKKFVPLWAEVTEEPKEEVAEEVKTEEVVAEPTTEAIVEEKMEEPTVEESKEAVSTEEPEAQEPIAEEKQEEVVEEAEKAA